jgi:DNA-binding HxlR family transcriptional regulator
MINKMDFEEYRKLVRDEEGTGTCRFGQALEIFNGKWRTRVTFELSKKEAYRFGELKKAIPQVTNTMLTSTLKDLEKMGIVHREQFNEIPPHVEYSLTGSGKALLPIFFEIAKWSEKYL